MSGGLILAVGTVAGLFAQKTKIPDVAVFLVAGMMIGPQALDLIDIKADSALYQILLLFGVLTVAMGTGDFSLSSSLLDLLTQAALGIAAGAILGYLAALLIAHERWAFFMEYAPVVTIMAVIGAYFAADGMRASGFMAVFVFGIMLGNKDSFGFKMGKTESLRLDQYVETTSFIMRLFIFILLGSQVDFGLMNRYLLDGFAVVAIFMLVARPATVFACTLPDRRAPWNPH